jgi:hypothetical protein
MLGAPYLEFGYAPTRPKAILALKHRWRERGPLKPGEMQDGQAGLDEGQACVQVTMQLSASRGVARCIQNGFSCEPFQKHKHNLDSARSCVPHAH